MLNLTPAVQQAVHAAIAAAEIPADKRGAFVLVADTTGVHAILAARVNDRWTIRAGLTHEWHGGDGAEAQVKAVW
jgi:hypothetical protein